MDIMSHHHFTKKCFFSKIELDWIQNFFFQKIDFFFLNFLNFENLQNSLPSHVIVCLSIDNVALGILEFFINMRIEPFRVVKMAPKLCFIKSKASQRDIKLRFGIHRSKGTCRDRKSRDLWAKRVGAIGFLYLFETRMALAKISFSLIHAMTFQESIRIFFNFTKSQFHNFAFHELFVPLV